MYGYITSNCNCNWFMYCNDLSSELYIAYNILGGAKNFANRVIFKIKLLTVDMQSNTTHRDKVNSIINA